MNTYNRHRNKRSKKGLMNSIKSLSKKPLKNNRGYLSVESAMIIPIVLCIIFSLTLILREQSFAEALVAVEDRKLLTKDFMEGPRIQLFVKIKAANQLGEFLNEAKEGQTDEQKKVEP